MSTFAEAARQMADEVKKQLRSAGFDVEVCPLGTLDALRAARTSLVFAHEWAREHGHDCGGGACHAVRTLAQIDEVLP